jgi:outer membrane protein assembly factor BamD (BamD/ComL family)
VIEITPAPAATKASSPERESLDSELNLLRQAQEDLRLGLPAQALRRLAVFDSRFPVAKLDQERRAIEAIAGCQVHPGPAALVQAQRFLQQAPLSPLAARVRSACQPAEEEGKSFHKTSPRREP